MVRDYRKKIVLLFTRTAEFYSGTCISSSELSGGIQEVCCRNRMPSFIMTCEVFLETERSTRLSPRISS